MKARQIPGCWLLNSSEHPGKVLLGGITSLAVGFVEKERKQGGKKLLYNSDANERFIFFKSKMLKRGICKTHFQAFAACKVNWIHLMALKIYVWWGFRSCQCSEDNIKLCLWTVIFVWE